ncbi:MAG TPA: hypothetical protein VHD59_06875 [Pseudolabrys sp.]|nr:hypothetical protein [Pseudolabrys sp.]
MTNILNPGQVTVIGGTASQYQSAIARELVFADVVSERHPVAIFLVDDPNDPAVLRNFHVWRVARRKPNTGNGRVHATDALHSAQDLDALVAKIDKLWGYVPSPLIVRDTSSALFKLDRWTAWAPEIARSYRAKCVTVVNTGVHPLIAMPLTEIPGDAHWQVTDDQLRVTAKNLATQESVQFIGRAVDGGMVFDAKEAELAHV